MSKPYTPTGHGAGPRTEGVPPVGTVFRAGRFGRMVPELTTPFSAPDAALVELGLAMIDTAPASQDGDHPQLPAAYTYLGQFVDHDLTLDTTGLTEAAQDPSAVENFRTPRLDLDSVYGMGPRVQPSLYDRTSAGRAKLLVGLTSPPGAPGAPPSLGGRAHDLPRNPQSLAIIGDERNDENLLVAQTHTAFLRFHNAIVDLLPATVPEAGRFDAARRATVDLYQAMVVRDFLPRICGEGAVAAAIEHRHGFRFEQYGAYGQPYMPIEFSVAAYRLGHSMVRQEYNHNRFFRPGGIAPGSLALLFEFTAKSGNIGTIGLGPASKPTLAGDWIIDWRRYLDFNTTDVSDGFSLNLSRRIDPFLVPELHQLGGGPPNPNGSNSLAVMNLRRGVKMALPSAQALAAFLGVPVLTPAEIATGPDGLVAEKHGLHHQTPLWYYILKEASVRTGGVHLGPLGALIVAETFVGLLQGDPESLLARNPTWRFGQPLPGLLLPGADVSFTLADLVATAAGGTTKAQLSPVDA